MGVSTSVVPFVSQESKHTKSELATISAFKISKSCKQISFSDQHQSNKTQSNRHFIVFGLQQTMLNCIFNTIKNNKSLHSPRHNTNRKSYQISEIIYL